MKGNYSKGTKGPVTPLANEDREQEDNKYRNSLAYLPLQVRRDVSNLNFPAPVENKSTDTTNRLNTTLSRVLTKASARGSDRESRTSCFKLIINPAHLLVFALCI